MVRHAQGVTMQSRGTKRKKESDRQQRRKAKEETAAARKEARKRALETGSVSRGSGPEVGEAQPPLDPTLVGGKPRPV